MRSWQQAGPHVSANNWGALTDVTWMAVFFYKLIFKDALVGMGCKDSGNLLYKKHYVELEVKHYGFLAAVLGCVMVCNSV